MGRPKQKISQRIETPFLGYCVVALALVCFLLLLVALMVLTRVLVG